MGERCKLPNRGLGQLCNFYNVEVTKHRIIITIKVGGGGGGGGGVQSTSGPIRKVGGGGQSASGRMPFFGTQKIRYRL